METPNPPQPKRRGQPRGRKPGVKLNLTPWWEIPPDQKLTPEELAFLKQRLLTQRRLWRLGRKGVLEKPILLSHVKRWQPRCDTRGGISLRPLKY